MTSRSHSIKIHPADNVAVALSPLRKGDAVDAEGKRFVLAEDIPQGHKFALVDIPAGSPVIKYGSPIGSASSFIRKGSWVHTHNLRTNLDGQLT